MKLSKYLILLLIVITSCSNPPHPLKHDVRLVVDITQGTNLDYLEFFKHNGTEYVALSQISAGGNINDPFKFIFIDGAGITTHPALVKYKVVYHKFDNSGLSDINANFKVVIDAVESGSIATSNLGHLGEQVVSFKQD